MDINPKRILVIQLKRVGDLVVTMPVLPALRAALPQAKVDFLVDSAFAPLLEHNPYLNQIHSFNQKAVWRTWRALRAASYDLILDFQSSPRSILAGIFSGATIRAGYQVTFWGRFFTRSMKRPGPGVSVTEGKMSLVRLILPNLGPSGERQIFLTDAERAWAKGQMGEAAKEQGVVGLVPTHRRPSRRWPAASFSKLARQVIAQGRPVWLFWGPGEEDYVAAIQRQVPESRMIPSTSLRQMASLLEQCRVVVTNDSGPMHLAEAVGASTVTMYGPTDPSSWNAGGPRHKVVQAQGLRCLGCNLNDCPFGHECMTQVTPERVLAEVS